MIVITYKYYYIIYVILNFLYNIFMTYLSVCVCVYVWKRESLCIFVCVLYMYFLIWVDIPVCTHVDVQSWCLLPSLMSLQTFYWGKTFLTPRTCQILINKTSQLSLVIPYFCFPGDWTMRITHYSFGLYMGCCDLKFTFHACYPQKFNHWDIFNTKKCFKIV